MLILTRYKEQSIMIGDDINVKVLSIKNNQISLGIEAPDDISIYREEIHPKSTNEKGEE